MKCKIVVFFIISVLFLQIYNFEVATFSLSLSDHLNFSPVFCIYNIYIPSEKVIHQNHVVYQYELCLKKLSLADTQIKTIQNKLT